jgi:hypothetical protein
LPFASIIVLPWTDPVVDAIGHDPRSPYVERFWLGILGPSTTLLLRHFADAFDAEPEGFELDVPTTAASLGLSATAGRNNPFARSLVRCVQFGLAQPHSRGLSARRRLPPLSHRQVARLPEALRDAHDAWIADERDERSVARARFLARAMLAVGDEPAAIERHLQLTGVPAFVSAEAVQWALAAGGEEVDDAA